MISPCDKTCKIQNGHCVGCKRTLQEIAQWSRMNETDRNKIIKQLEER